MSEATIDCSKPEEYEVCTPNGWEQVVALVDTGAGKGSLRYSVLYKSDKTKNDHDHLWRGTIDLRRKPVWEPEVGKVYLFSDYKGAINRALTQVLSSGREAGGTVVREYLGRQGEWYLARSPAGIPVEWRYCWPIPREELGA